MKQLITFIFDLIMQMFEVAGKEDESVCCVFYSCDCSSFPHRTVG